MVDGMPNKPPPIDLSACKLHVVWGVLGIKAHGQPKAFTSSAEKWRSYRLVFDRDFDMSTPGVQQVCLYDVI